MAYIKNTWVDREGQTRYHETIDDDGALIFTPDYEKVTEIGTPVNADNMNHIEEGIAAGSFTKFDLNATYAKDDLVTAIEDASPVIYKSLQDNNIGNTLSDTAYWEKISLGGGTGFNLFDTKLSDHLLEGAESLGWALQGTWVSKAIYPDFYAKCLDEQQAGMATETTLGDSTITLYINSNGHQFYDTANKAVIDNFYNAMGVAWYYGIDRANERIFLPRNKYLTSYIADGTKSVSVYGNGSTLGLSPDGQNTIYSMANTSNYGLITNTAGYKKLPASGTTVVSYDNKLLGVCTDPNRSGLTGSLNLQNTSNNQYVYICVGNTTVNEALVDVGQLSSDLQYKLDKSEVKAYITETYQNGTSWYRVYSDGWCEQGGRTLAKGSATGSQVNLLKTYANSTYNVCLCVWHGDDVNNTGTWAKNLLQTTSSFNIATGYTGASTSAFTSYYVDWETKGYLA